ncbi:hypothetical protein GYMLUDRAFT_62343 [Collybiopsis luxurians FD-317 M1]|uniref:Tyrosinase copper-binding domain-containing protein n=1 Tax=Collybiopsis luxurians FD-317 M1 TaxID=944289 RepID=A0A0D0CKT8_9AGAR|nr:hypothetical protein GYMLUDRAFT_62343 [Collybiopsis luxurians FD-317 M1]
MSDIPYFIHGIQGGIHGRPYERWSGDPTGILDQIASSMELISLSGRLLQPWVLEITLLEAILFPIWHRPYVLALEQSIGEAAIVIASYCNHGSILFPIWHRPYVLALEQSIGEAAIVIASKLTEGLSDDVKKIWNAAAQQLRFPLHN